ncbi:MAG: hypothetical protein QG625_1477 [Cyanobacteriota bacterium erpe_2018_sw_39hr_WHONDRS-SW48-000098_B_bin.30]|jgi:hypothetical protein|nr:hypothetical protein [Cyanobacteriota bacterium erpe_2018_sw_39hr_WHONDRS-SW48-000098_B_bin.30]
MSNLAAITKKQLPQLCLPREHGIVVILLIASLYSLVLQIKSVLFCTALLTLWLLVLSLQHPRQLMAIASISALSHACFNPLMALWITIVGTGLILISKTKIKQTWWHEFIGLGGATIAPLLTAFMVSNQLRLPLTIGTALLAGVYTSAAIIHGATLASGKGRHEKAQTLLSLTLALPFWLGFTRLDPLACSLSLVPYVGLILWLAKAKATGFKTLGRFSAGCLSWVAITLLLTLRI